MHACPASWFACTPSVRKIYRFKYMFGGRQRVETLGEHGIDLTTEAARAEAEILRGRRAAGDDPAAARRASSGAATLRVAELIAMWLRDGPAAAPNKRASSWSHDASRLNRHILPLLGSRPIDSLKPAGLPAKFTVESKLISRHANIVVSVAGPSPFTSSPIR